MVHIWNSEPHKRFDNMLLDNIVLRIEHCNPTPLTIIFCIYSVNIGQKKAYANSIDPGENAPYMSVHQLLLFPRTHSDHCHTSVLQ